MSGVGLSKGQIGGVCWRGGLSQVARDEGLLESIGKSEVPPPDAHFGGVL